MLKFQSSFVCLPPILWRDTVLLIIQHLKFSASVRPFKSSFMSQGPIFHNLMFNIQNRFWPFMQKIEGKKSKASALWQLKKFPQVLELFFETSSQCNISPEIWYWIKKYKNHLGYRWWWFGEKLRKSFYAQQQHSLSLWSPPACNYGKRWWWWIWLWWWCEAAW